MLPKLTPELALQLLNKHGSSRKASEATGYSVSALLRAAKPFRKADGSLGALEVTEGTVEPAKEDVPQVLGGLERAAKDSGVDLSDIQRGWIKTKDYTLQVGCVADTKFELSDFFLDCIKQSAPESKNHPAGSKMLVIGLVDAHFGKLAFRKETGEDYDLKIACKIYDNVVTDALKFFGNPDINEIVLVIGSDMFHSNNFKSETVAGTKLESVDDRQSHVFQTVRAAVVRAIDACYSVANVHIIWAGGNHDEESSWHLSQVIKERYAGCAGITLDDSPVERKYHRFGSTLLGITHKPSEKLMGLMSVESPHWSECHTREFLVGHLHSRRVKWSVDEKHGFVMRILPSVCATDRYHHVEGYVGNVRAAEIYQYDFESGLDGYYLAKVRA